MISAQAFPCLSRRRTIRSAVLFVAAGFFAAGFFAAPLLRGAGFLTADFFAAGLRERLFTAGISAPFGRSGSGSFRPSAKTSIGAVARFRDPLVKSRRVRTTSDRRPTRPPPPRPARASARVGGDQRHRSGYQSHQIRPTTRISDP